MSYAGSYLSDWYRPDFVVLLGINSLVKTRCSIRNSDPVLSVTFAELKTVRVLRGFAKHNQYLQNGYVDSFLSTLLLEVEVKARSITNFTIEFGQYHVFNGTSSSESDEENKG